MCYCERSTRCEIAQWATVYTYVKEVQAISKLSSEVKEKKSDSAVALQLILIILGGLESLGGASAVLGEG